MIQRIQGHARTRLAFRGEVAREARLAAVQRFLRLETELVHRHHRAGDSGRKVAEALATVMDNALAHLLAYALADWDRRHGSRPAPIALLALGGFGRRELCPRSDVDVMFLYPAKVRDPRLEAFQKHITDEILYILWDCGLKVGHSSRALDVVFEEARSDILTKTSLLDARLVAGESTLFDTFAQAYRNYYLHEDIRSYIEARLKDQDSRRAKYGGTVFLQEPDIKAGVGGLRDYQNALWMARVKLGASRLSDLTAQGYLSAKEEQELTAAYDFLLRVRNDLHFNSRVATDLLTLDAQPAVAERLGYRERDALRRVEEFMRDYYRHAQGIYGICRFLENRLALKPGPTEQTRLSFRDVILSRRHTRQKKIDGFILRGSELACESPDVFRLDPRRLVRVFRHCQQLDAQPDFDLAALIRASIPLINHRLIASPEANISFRSILEASGQVAPTLNLMHELGVLGRFVPEFGRITCLVQHEYYHRYTADIHTLNTIRELDGVFTGTEDITLKYGSEVRETTSPALLYTALFLHDLGKATGIKNHAEVGVRVAIPILDRLQFTPADTELTLFLIRNHLAMARFWQKFDVDDPDSAIAFTQIVGDIERLRHLYVLTFCDARGTAASLWNGYKDTLHSSLFRACKERLTLGNAVELRHSERRDMMRQHFRSAAIAGITQEEIDAHFSLLPDRYFLHASEEEVTLHIRMVHQLIRNIAHADSLGSLMPIIDWKDDLNRSLTVINVITWDRAGLFYRLAGALSVAGLNILSARIHTRNDHIAIDTFHVVEPGRGIVQSQQIMAAFQRNVEQALIHNRDATPDIAAQARKLKSALFNPERTLPHTFAPHVDVYHELSLKRTILEVQAKDQIGLLFRLSRTIYEHGFDITFARISTERGVAVDTFYIEPANRAQPKSTAELLELRDAISEVITPPELVQSSA